MDNVKGSHFSDTMPPPDLPPNFTQGSLWHSQVAAFKAKMDAEMAEKMKGSESAIKEIWHDMCVCVQVRVRHPIRW